MNLSLLSHYFSTLLHAQTTLNLNRNTIPSTSNTFALYKLLAPKSQPQVDAAMMINFIKSFTYNFQNNQVDTQDNFAVYPGEDRITVQQLMARGVQLFLNQWSNTSKLTFEQFTLFLKQQSEFPTSQPGQVDFSTKKALFRLLQAQIQSLLDAENIRKTISLQYKNLQDLFQMLSLEGKIQIQQINNLLLMHGVRKTQQQLQNVTKRFPLPCDYNIFKKWFSGVATAVDKYKPQTKIYYSSIKRKKYDDEQGDRFTTPRGKTELRGATSTKMTKNDRIQSIKRSQVQVSRFSLEESPEQSARSILVNILAQQQALNEQKRTLIYQPDYDLELIYQRRGAQFQSLLNRKYGTCNFTSFVRYLVPQDFEHRYLAFLKYQKENKLSAQTQQQIDQLLTKEQAKQDRILKLWTGIDRQIVFRGYCQPGDKSIPTQQLRKYFTQRECKILLDRLDPSKTGQITLANFN